jgi:hypothetical protein
MEWQHGGEVTGQQVYLGAGDGRTKWLAGWVLSRVICLVERLIAWVGLEESQICRIFGPRQGSTAGSGRQSPHFIGPFADFETWRKTCSTGNSDETVSRRDRPQTVPSAGVFNLERVQKRLCFRNELVTEHVFPLSAECISLVPDSMTYVRLQERGAWRAASRRSARRFVGFQCLRRPGKQPWSQSPLVIGTQYI